MIRRLLTTGVLAITLVLLVSPAGVAKTSSASVSLIAQSPWIADDGDLALDLRITGAADEAKLVLQLHRAVDRRSLLALWDGMPDSPLGSPVEIPVTEVRNSAGVASLVLQVGTEGRLESRPGGVYPLSVTLVDNQDRLLDRLTTPLVHLPVVPEGEAASHRPLLVGISLTIDGPPPLHPDGSLRLDEATIRQLDGVIQASLDHPRIPLDVRLPPATVLGLAQSDDLDHARLLADLVRASAAGLRLQSGPFVTADPEAWRRAGRPDIHRDLVDHGDQVLADLLGVARSSCSPLPLYLTPWISWPNWEPNGSSCRLITSTLARWQPRLRQPCPPDW